MATKRHRAARFAEAFACVGYMVSLWLYAGSGRAVAQTPNTAELPAYEVHTQYNVSVRMRDGVRLYVDLYLPVSRERLPVILCMTLYGKSNREIPGCAPQHPQCFAARGYAVAVADMRGRYDSGGTWDPDNPKQKTDGYDLVEWLAKQP